MFKKLNGWKLKIGGILGGIATFLMFMPPIQVASINGEPVSATAVVTALATAFGVTGVAGKIDKFTEASKK